MIKRSGDRPSRPSRNRHITTSPTAFRDSRDITFEGELPEAQAAQRELPHIRARAAAQVAAVAEPNLVLRLLLFLRDLGGREIGRASCRERVSLLGVCCY